MNQSIFASVALGSVLACAGVAHAEEPADAPAASTAPVASAPPAPAAPAPPPPAAPDEAFKPSGRFEFGSYGRVLIASDLRGQIAQPVNVVSHGTRLDEDSYAELELRREDDFARDIHSRVVATLAFAAPFFHMSGKPEQFFFIRNLYAQSTYGDAVFWAGSRMYRGDDAYLLNWWPLDNQNTIGGGAGYDFKKTDTLVAAHVGMQRLDNPYQHQVTQVTSPFGIGSTGVQSLNRPRWVETLKLTQFVRDPARKPGMKFILYGEVHEIGAGVYEDPTSQQQVGLPSDWGFVAGAQFGLWSGEHDEHLNVFVRYGRGLGAYDVLEAPTTFANDRTTGSAQDGLVAATANVQRGPMSVMAAGYVRYFTDGSEALTSRLRYNEGTIVVRPHLFLGEHFGLAAEVSYQARLYAAEDPAATDGSRQYAGIWRFGVMPYFSPTGRGSFKRPQFRLVYALSALNAGARANYPVEDIRAQNGLQHYLGLNVEWWFNSSSYP